MADRIGRVYCLYDPLTGELRYVGKTIVAIRRRLNEHLSVSRRRPNSHKSRWILSLDRPPLIDVLQELPVGQLYEAEQYWIRFLRGSGCRLVNLTDGGPGALGYKPTDETRLKMSNVMKRIGVSSNARIAAAEYWTGRQHTEDTKRKIASTHKWTGRRHSEETKRKISETRRRYIMHRGA